MLGEQAHSTGFKALSLLGFGRDTLEIVPCDSQGRMRPEAWIHIDGAFGLWAAASPAHAHLVRGMDRADSWSADAHKTLNAP